MEPDELEDLRSTARLLLAYDETQLEAAVVEGELWEIECDDEAIQE